MTKTKRAQQHERETKSPSEQLSDPEYREALRRALSESADQGDLFYRVERFSISRLHEALLESLDYIEVLLDELQLEEHHSMSLGKAYGWSQHELRRLRMLHERMMLTEDRKTNRSHFAKQELRRDEVLRLTRQAIDVAHSDTPALFEHLDVSADHSGEWGCALYVTGHNVVLYAVPVASGTSSSESAATQWSAGIPEMEGKERCLELVGRILSNHELRDFLRRDDDSTE